MKEQTVRLGTIKITDFALKHFNSKFGGTKILNLEPEDFELHLNTFKNIYFDKPEDRMIEKAIGHVRVDILDGYAPFCKLLVMANITDARTGTLPITLENYQYLRSGYSARRGSEVPVLSRWLDLPLRKPVAKYTVTVLYSKAQIDKEAKSEYDKAIIKGGVESIGLEAPESFGADWGVVAILGQMIPREEPMKPMTMMRNYMDISMGGSGMKLPTIPVKPNHFDFNDKAGYEIAMKNHDSSIVRYKEEIKEFNEIYEKSIKFWSENATVK